MKTDPNPPNWEVLAGMVERVTYQKAGWLLCHPGEGPATASLSLWLAMPPPYQLVSGYCDGPMI